MKRKLLKGFTLIELMIVVAIVAILASIAVPAYQNYTTRAQLAEVFTFADNAKTAVSVFLQTGVPSGVTSLSNTTVGVDTLASGQYVTNLVVSGVVTSPVIVVDFSNTAAGSGSVTFTGSISTDGQTMIWTCTSTLDQKYLPSSCSGTP